MQRPLIPSGHGLDEGHPFRFRDQSLRRVGVQDLAERTRGTLTVPILVRSPAHRREILYISFRSVELELEDRETARVDTIGSPVGRGITREFQLQLDLTRRRRGAANSAGSPSGRA